MTWKKRRYLIWYFPQVVFLYHIDMHLKNSWQKETIFFYWSSEILYSVLHVWLYDCLQLYSLDQNFEINVDYNLFNI